MSQSYVQFYCHIVFHTKNNEKLISDSIENELHAYIGGILKNCRSNPIKIGGTSDHIHILCTLPKTMSISNLVEEIKKSTSKWIKTKGSPFTNFYWQDGYGGFSVSPSITTTVSNYIACQKSHHKETTNIDEYKTLLKENGVDFDERYL
jgi:putative transposase